jgi:hypothetical protein
MFAAIAGKDGASVGYAVSFRRRVMIEFERLVAAGQLDMAVARYPGQTGLRSHLIGHSNPRRACGQK